MDLIAIADLCMQSGTQIRSHTDRRVIARYVAVLKRGEELPPATVYFDGNAYHLADGFHRVAAWTSRGLTAVPCDVRRGSRREAILFAVGANATHGLPRTNQDKRRAVLTLLKDEEWSNNTDRWIAEHCAVSHTFVSRIRATLSSRNAESQNGTAFKDASHSDASETQSRELDPTQETGGNGCHVETVELEAVGNDCHLDTTRESPSRAADAAEIDDDVGAPHMRRGRDGKWYPVRLSSVPSATGDNAESAESVEGRVLEPLFRIILDRITGASRYAIEQFAIMTRPDQIAVLSFLVGGGAETLDEALRIDRTASVLASMVDESVLATPGAAVPEFDVSGREIPERVAPSMAEVPVLKTLLTEVRRVRRRWSATLKRYETAAVPNMGPLFRTRDAIDSSLRAAERTLSGTVIPHAVCGYCKGRDTGCRGCGGAGWLGKEDHAAVPSAVSTSPLTADEMGWWLVPNQRTGT